MENAPNFRESALSRATRIAIVSLITGCVTLTQAAIPIEQTPPVQKSKSEPAPNIILTLDDSGSMDERDVTMNGRTVARIDALKESVNKAFSAYENNEFRLAYQSLSDVEGGRSFSDVRQLMKPFSGQHRTDFLAWNTNLGTPAWTPLRIATLTAGLYTRGYVNIRFPRTVKPYPLWNNGRYPIYDTANATWDDTRLGTTYTYHGQEYQYDPLEGLDCRRTVHILMTDGGWNDGFETADYPLRPSNKQILLPDNPRAQIPQPVDAAESTAYNLRIVQDNSGNIYPSLREPFGTTPLANITFNQWATDLRPDLGNNIRKIIRRTGNEEFTYGARSKTVPEWWNPKNNPATWQGLQTYTIGFGGIARLSALKRPGGVETGYFSNPDDYMYTGNFFNKLITTPQGDSTTEWGSDNDLWHAAYNGRGKYYAAQSGDALRDAFVDILANITADSSSKAEVTAAGSSSKLTGDTMVYTASYDAKNNKWTGKVDFWRTGDLGNSSKTPKASSNVPTAGGRTILTSIAGAGRAFQWSSFSSLDESTTPKLSELHLDNGKVTAMRDKPLGDIVNSGLTLVGKATGGLYRGNDYRHFATKINSRTRMVYAGANDGMLHGFDAGKASPTNPGTGAEKLAYIPRGILPRLKDYLHADYEHQYFVDGTPFSGDAQIAGMQAESGAANYNGWRTVLVGSLGAGGKGYFVLDVTNPDSFAESNASQIVLVDKTDSTDPDIGQQIGAPATLSTDPTRSAQIVQINIPSTVNPGRKQWAVIMGNGVNSTNGRPVLLVQSLEGSKTLYKIDACGSAATPSAQCNAKPAVTSGKESNGLSTPTSLDLNGDGAADVVYAGDLQGNMWKFDISSADTANWQVGLGGSPLFTAQGLPEKTKTDLTTAYRQSITVAPLVVPHPNGGFMVVFGTGRNFNKNDATDNNAANLNIHGQRLNSFYGVRDLQRFTIASNSEITFDAASATGISSALQVPNSSSRFTALELQNVSAMTLDNENNLYRSASSANAIASTSLGWYIDLPEIRNNNATKLLQSPVLNRGNVVKFTTTNVASEYLESGSPTQEICGINQNYSGAKYQWRFFNIFTGANPNLPLYIDGVDINAGLATKTNSIEFNDGGIPIHTEDGSITTRGKKQSIGFPKEPGKLFGWRIIR